MATFIFSNFDDFKNNVGGAVNQSVLLESLTPTIEEVAHTHIIPWLTQELWDALVSEVETPASQTLANLLPYVQKSVAFLTMWEYAKIGGVQFSEAGLLRTESETHKTAYKNQENAYREQMRNHGFNALERMLIFLETNKADYPDWTDNDGLAYHRAVFLHLAKDMQREAAQKITRYTYNVLRPLIADLETFVLEPLLGADFLAELRTDFLADDLTEKQTELIKLLRKPLTHFAIHEGIQRMWVQINGDTIVQREKLEPQSYEKEGVPTTATTGPIIDLTGQWANRHLSYVRKYLTANIDHADFELYKTYQEELAAAAEAAAEAEEVSPLGGDGRGAVQTPTVDAADYRRATPGGTFRF